jgi:hypothetical protein
MVPLEPIGVLEPPPPLKEETMKTALALLLTLLLAGCGGIANIGPTLTPLRRSIAVGSDFPAPQLANRAPRRIPPPPPTASNLSGAWEFQLVSSDQGAGLPTMNLVEVDLQQSGSTLSASGNYQQMTVLSAYPNASFTDYLACLYYAPGNLTGAVSGGTADVVITLTNGSATQDVIEASATINSNGTLTGTYQNTQGGCPPNDSGTFTGAAAIPFSGTYSGQLEDGAGDSESVSLTMAEGPDFAVSITATTNGSPLAVSGIAIGNSIVFSSTFDGQTQSIVSIGYLENSSTMQVWSGAYSGILELKQ